MKIRITFKDPDAVTDAVENAIKATRPDGLTDEEWTLVSEQRFGGLSLAPFIEFHEYCTVEIDTDARTATVVPRT